MHLPSPLGLKAIAAKLSAIRAPFTFPPVFIARADTVVAWSPKSACSHVVLWTFRTRGPPQAAAAYHAGRTRTGCTSTTRARGSAASRTTSSPKAAGARRC